METFESKLEALFAQIDSECQPVSLERFAEAAVMLGVDGMDLTSMFAEISESDYADPIPIEKFKAGITARAPSLKTEAQMRMIFNAIDKEHTYPHVFDLLLCPVQGRQQQNQYKN